MIASIFNFGRYLLNSMLRLSDRGRAGGRKKKLPEEEIRQVKLLMDAAVLPFKEVTEKFGVSVVML